MSSFGRPDGGGADDDAAGEALLLAELPHDAAQPGALLARVDLPRHADVVDRRHEHEEPAGERGVGRQPRALGAERLLDDLHEDFLPFAEQVSISAPVARPSGAPGAAPPLPRRLLAPGLVVRLASSGLVALVERPRGPERRPRRRGTRRARGRCRRTPTACRAAPSTPGPCRCCRRRRAGVRARRRAPRRDRPRGWRRASRGRSRR